MSAKLTPYVISEFKSGLLNYQKPWIRPQDAFEPLQDAYVYRGVLNKRNGSSVFGNQLADQQPVMGIMQRIDESNGNLQLVVASTRAAYLYSPGATPSGGTFTALTAVGGNNSVFWIGTATGTITAPTFWPHITPSSVSITDGTTTITDNGVGTLSSGGIFAAAGTINYTTGVVVLNFSGTTNNVSLKITATLATPTSMAGYFTGNNTNFFNWVNWQPTDPITFTNSTSYLYITNDVDPVTLFDGTSLSRPIFYINSTHTDYIVTTRDLKVYQNRLLMFRPTILVNTGSPVNYLLNQSIYFSALYNPFNFINDVAGNGGQITPATGDILLSSELLRDAIVMFFTNSTWLLRFTGLNSPPFQVLKLNGSKTSNSPYATISYDERCTSMGSTGFIACDGTYVQRYDVPIIEYYETEISERYYAQTFGTRYDNLNQAWMMYVSNGTQNPVVGTGAPGSDRALIYNFVENTWATYTFSVPMTCMGIFYSQLGLTWELATFSWDTADSPWNAYSSQKSAPILLGGDVNGYVYWMDNENTVADNELPISSEIIAVGDGTKVYSGTVDHPGVVPGTFIATDGVETFTDQGDGSLIGSLGGEGDLIYPSGEWSLNFNTAVTMSTNITSNYTSGLPITSIAKTTKWNPVVGIGQKTQFCYIDIYYSVASITPTLPVELVLNFFVDNNESSEAAQRTLTLDGPVTNSYAWKRIYVNLIGEFIQMNIDPNEYSPFEILGFILWIKSSGRFTP